MSKAAALFAPSSLAMVVEVSDGRDDDRVDLARLDAGAVQRLPCGSQRHHLNGLVVGCPATFDDPGPGADPLV
jgi:hypothetical protein